MFASEVGRLSHGTFVPGGAPALFPWSARPAKVSKVVLEFLFAECFEPFCARAGVAFKNLHDKPFFGTHVECSFRSGVNSQSGGARAERERITRVGPQYLFSARNARNAIPDLVPALVISATSRVKILSFILATNLGKLGGRCGNWCGGPPAVWRHLRHLGAQTPKWWPA